MELGIEALDPAENHGYGNWPLPCDRDEEIQSLLTSGRLRSASGLNPSHGDVLLAFAERLASLARRESSRQRLEAGFAAVEVVAALSEDREAVLVLALLWHAAEELGVDPESLCAAVVDLVGSCRSIQRFGERDPMSRTIQAMGYEEVLGESGRYYRRTW